MTTTTTGVRGRAYQHAALDAIHARFAAGDPSTLCVLPTGTGKTVLAGMACRRGYDEYGWKTLFLAERRVLIQQTYDKLREFGLKCARETGLLDAQKLARVAGHAQVVIATPQTLKGDRLLSWDKSSFQQVITDECHHVLSDQYARVLGHFEGYRHVGITATPGRGDGKNLGRVYKSKAYQMRLHEDAIAGGWLVPYDAQVLPVQVDLRDLKKTRGDLNVGELVERIGPKIEVLCRAVAAEIGDRQGVVFTPDQASAAAAADVLTKLGVPARYVAGSAGKFGMKAKEQKAVLAEYNRLETQVLCCCELLTEGWDCPACSLIAVMRPTRSRFRYAQMLGRGLRPCEALGKTDCLLLDFDWRTDDGARDLMTPVDLHDDGDEAIDPEIVREAKRRVRDDGLTVTEAIEKAEQSVRSRPRVDIALMGVAADYRKYRRNPAGVTKILGIRPLKHYDFDRYKRNPISAGQAGFLRSLGVEESDGLSKYGASKLIKELKARRDAGLAPVDVVHALECHGVHEDIARGMAVDAAAGLLRRIKTQQGVLFAR